MKNEYRIFKDGAAWCAVNEEFVNLQESDAGFGDSPVEALGELLAAEESAEKARCEKVREWKCNNCQTSFGRKAPRGETPSCPCCKCGGQYVYERSGA